MRCLRDQCNAYEVDWRMKLEPLARLVEKESQDKQRHQTSSEDGRWQTDTSTLVQGRRNHSTQPPSTTSESQARCNKSSGVLILAERTVTTAIKLSESESDAEMADSSGDVPLILRTRVLRPAASKQAVQYCRSRRRRDGGLS